MKDWLIKNDLVTEVPEEPVEEESEPIIDSEELVENTSKNIMNTMLPSTKVLGKRERPENPELD